MPQKKSINQIVSNTLYSRIQCRLSNHEIVNNNRDDSLKWKKEWNKKKENHWGEKAEIS